MSFNPMLPFTHPLSVLNENQNHQEFNETLKTLSRKYNAFAVPDDYSWTRRSVRCYRQYFRTEISPDGSINRCFPQLYFDYYAKRMKSIFSNNDLFLLPGELKEMLGTFFSSKYRPICHFPCNCEEEIESLFHMGEDSVTDPENRLLSLFHNNLPFCDDETQKAACHIQNHLNPKFRESFLKCFQRT